MGTKKLADIIDYNLDILFIGYNPSPRSADFGHHFAGRGNNFWRLLHRSGITDELCTFEQDRDILNLGYGITNIVDRPTKAADEITREEYSFGKEKLLKKINKYRPKVACFVGVGVYKTYAGKSKTPWGSQDIQMVDGVNDFIVPNPSGLNRMLFDEQLQYYHMLKEFVDQLKQTNANIQNDVLRILSETYPDPKTALNFSNSFELLIATMLSAQSTDKQVNIITEKLYE